MTLLDLVNRIKSRSHRGDTAITSDTITQQIIDSVNDSRREVVRMIPLKWLRKEGSITTIAGSHSTNPTPKYDLEADCQEPLYFRFTFSGSDYFLKKIDSEREFYKQVFSSQTVENKPSLYYDAGLNAATKKRQIYVWPIANTAYTINYAYMSDPTTSDLTTTDLGTDMYPFPSYVQDVLWKGGLYHFLKNFDDVNGQKIAKMDYEEAKMAVENADQRDLDSDVALRFDLGTRYNIDPVTGIRIYP
jgi:hypothetical protein